MWAIYCMSEALKTSAKQPLKKLILKGVVYKKNKKTNSVTEILESDANKSFEKKHINI